MKQPVLVKSSMISVGILLMKFLLIDKSRKRRSNLPPGPPTLPIIGNLHQLGNMPHLSLQSLAHKYGPLIYLQLGQIPTLVVSSAKLAKEVLKTHDLALANHPQLFAAKHLLYNCTDITFAPYGAYWQRLGPH
ncbi:putative psoralen synthase [Lupinus albus]|uniref:Putative psoralen synthase n=1 Tax=Lupinus albus TaxID=3870 RepID=A0A6A4PS24_LUPAL|nr:putative psoralen synthase [Lupinus albus]